MAQATFVLHSFCGEVSGATAHSVVSRQSSAIIHIFIAHIDQPGALELF